MNKDRIQGQWKPLAGALREKWDKLTPSISTLPNVISRRARCGESSLGIVRVH